MIPSTRGHALGWGAGAVGPLVREQGISCLVCVEPSQGPHQSLQSFIPSAMDTPRLGPQMQVSGPGVSKGETEESKRPGTGDLGGDAGTFVVDDTAPS